MFQRIIGQMPPHSVYVEPFFGSGQIFWRKRPAAVSVIIDKALARADLPAGAVLWTQRDLTGLRSLHRRAGVHAICGDAISVLHTLSLPADAVVYCDPPYLLSTRAGRRYYAHEMEDHHHAALLALLLALRCRVLLSGYPSDLYGRALRTWRCLSYRTRTRGKTVTECLWCNFPEPALLHDWRYAGKSFRERLSLRRLAARWMARLEDMPERKRGYVLATLGLRPCGPPAPELASGAGTARQF